MEWCIQSPQHRAHHFLFLEQNTVCQGRFDGLSNYHLSQLGHLCAPPYVLRLLFPSLSFLSATKFILGRLSSLTQRLIFMTIQV